MHLSKFPASFIIWLNRLSIATKVTLGFSVLVLASATAVGFLIYSGNSQLLIASSKERLKHNSQILSVQFAATIKGMHDDIRLMAKNPVFEAYVQALPGSKATSATAFRPQVSQLFRSLLESRPDYLQVSFIDANNRKAELVRFNQVEGNIAEVPTQKLNTVEGVLYFDEVSAFAPDQIYISNLALYRENGELRYPYIPSVKASMPIYGANQKLIGVLLINLNLNSTFEHLQSIADRQTSLYLTNNTGDYLLHPDKDKIFGFEKGQRWLLQNEFPESKAVIMGAKPTLQFDEVQSGIAGPMLLNLERLNIFNDQNRFLVLGVGLPYASLLAGLQQVRNTSLLITLAICICGILLTFLFSRFLIQPLQHITQAVSDFAAGKSNLPVSHNRYDEIGVLSQAFSQMAHQIQAQMEELAYKEKGIRTIIETTIEAIIIINQDGKIEQFNQAAENILGYKAINIIGEPISKILTAPGEQVLREQPDNFSQAILALVGRGRETTATRLDGEQIHVYLALSSFEVAGDTKYTAIIHDISARKKAEEELIQAKQLAEEANIAKDEFLSVMSHEIRTPMNAVIGMTRLLLQNEPTPRQFPIINTLKFSADNLMALINDILDFSKIRAGKIEFEEADFNLKELLTKIMLSYEPKCEEKNIQLQYIIAEEVPEWVKGDAVRLSQILNNLVGNAVKFTHQGKVQVQISLDKKSTPAEPYCLCFAVADTGIGIAADRQPFILERFTQGSSDTTRKYGGSGLGLAITKNLVELQNGRLLLESKLGEGSRFTVYLPFKEATATPVIPTLKPATPLQLAGLRLLYVEDVAFNQFLIQNYLLKTGIHLDLADNGLAAIAMSKTQDYDLILMDLQMPEMDGFQTTAEIRQFNTTVPIIALTALVSDKAKEKLYEAGMNDYLLKPVDQDELLQKIAFYTVGALPAAPVQTTKPGNTKSKKVIDYQALEEAYDHDGLKLEKALRLIRSEFVQHQQEFTQAIREKNLTLFAASHHKIKPHLQLLQLQSLSGQLETVRQALAEKLADTAKMSEELNITFELLLKEIEARIAFFAEPVALPKIRSAN